MSKESVSFQVPITEDTIRYLGYKAQMQEERGEAIRITLEMIKAQIPLNFMAVYANGSGSGESEIRYTLVPSVPYQSKRSPQFSSYSKEAIEETIRQIAGSGELNDKFYDELSQLKVGEHLTLSRDSNPSSK